MTVERVDDTVDRKVNLLVSYFSKPRLEQYLRAFLNEIRLVENAILDVQDQLDVDNAVGAQLDRIGSLVNEPRSGRADDQYKIAIKLRALLNVSSGTREQIIEVTLLVVELFSETLESPVVVTSVPPKAITVLCLGIVNEAAESLISYLRTTVAAGTRVVLHTSESDLIDSFVWDATSNGQYWDSGNWVFALE